MGQDTRADVATRRVVYELLGEGNALVRPDLEYTSSSGESLAFDLYEPPGGDGPTPRPVVVLVTGYNDLGMQRFIGCKAKEMESYRSWGRLMAASGMMAVTYECREPAADAPAVLRHLRDASTTLGIDRARIAVWSCSGNVPNALGLLMNEPGLAGAALLYGYMLDLDGHAHVADAAVTFRFATPAAGRSVHDLPADLPLFIGRAGRDETPGLNDSLDRFVAHALRENRPVTVVNHHTGPHAFDITDNSQASRNVVRAVLEFLRARLGG